MHVGKPRFALILSGCGVHDGSEIHETVLTLLAVSKHGGTYQCFAPDKPQHRVVNHLTGEEMPETRNALVEAARIARGAIRDLRTFDAAEHDAVILPGGLGAATTLSDFAAAGAGCSVDEQVARAVRTAHAAGKPIGALCVAPVILARVLGCGAMTIGHDADVAGAIEAMGARHRGADHGDVVVDVQHRLVTSPCYMLEARIEQIAEDVESAVLALTEMIGRQARTAAE
jgi:enhancing lycopene biosynthesis protein 2